jgi:hypothetical protein
MIKDWLACVLGFGVLVAAMPALAQEDEIPEGDGGLAKVLKQNNYDFCLYASSFYSLGSLVEIPSTGGDGDIKGFLICSPGGEWKVCKIGQAGGTANSKCSPL